MSRFELPEDIVADLQSATFWEVADLWKLILDLYGDRGKAALGRADRFYLLTVLLNRPDAIHPWLYDRCREVEAEPDECLDLWARFHYKAVDTEYPVPTPDGWKKHGDLVPGDTVFGADGQQCHVVAKTQVWVDAECYEVTTDDGFSVVVSGQHLWTVKVPSKARIDGSKRRDGWRVETMNTVELMRQVAHSKRVDSRPRVRIPVSLPVVCEEKNLVVDPYLLGAWLGDGSTGGTRITSGYEDAVEMQQILEKTGTFVAATKHSNAVSLKIGNGVRGNRTSSEFANGLRELGVYRDKRIPALYQRASVDQRWALLQGLMDTDGSCKSDGQCMFVSSRQILAVDVFGLCLSLGLKPSIYERKGKYRNELRSFWQVQFRGCAENPPFRLQRKRDKCPTALREISRMVVSVMRVASIPVSCIQVDRDDGLYLIGRNYLATHNSTFITFAGAIQEILLDADITVGLFAYVKQLSAKFLGQIKYELETNEELKRLYPEVLWADPKKDARRAGASWDQYRIDVRRNSNPKEGTVEAHGLTDGQPTGAHFKLRIYDDVVTRESVTSPEMVKKTTECWELSDNLKSTESARRWHIGTRYSFADTYGEILERGILKPRIYPATEDGTPEGNPVFLSEEVWADTRLNQRTTLAAQMLQNPTAGKESMFLKEELKFIDVRPETLNIYIMVDPASSKKKGSDRTAMAVIAVDAARNKYLVDGFCHKMNLQERWANMQHLRKTWMAAPGVQRVSVGYERFGMRSDLEHFEEKMEEAKSSFEIRELSWPQDTPGAKIDRIQRLVPDFGKGRFFLPMAVTREINSRKVAAESARQIKMKQQGKAFRILKPTVRRDHEGNAYSLTKIFLDEYLVYPFSRHDDFLDACSRIYDMDYRPPVIIDQGALEPEVA